MTFNLDRVEEYRDQIYAYAERALDRLNHIPQAQVQPDLDDLRFAEARQLSVGVVFIDIHQSGRYLSENGAKETLFMLNIVIPQLMQIVRDHEGHFEKNTGDGILAYFGVGKSHQTSVEEILGFLAAVRYTINELINPILEEHDAEPISITGGAAYAEDVFVSRIGIRNQSNLTAISTAANASFELEEMADEGEFLVNDGIYNFSDQENGWGRGLYLEGTLSNWNWGSEDKGFSPARYYRFDGVYQLE